MRVEDFFEVLVWSDDNNPGTLDWVDISDGLLSANIRQGNDFFQGHWDSPETGQFTIVTRNQNLDPYVSNLIRTNRPILFRNKATSDTILSGFVTSFNVEYRKDDKPLITINGVDIFGFMNRIQVDDNFIDNYILPYYPDAILPAKNFLEAFWQFMYTEYPQQYLSASALYFSSAGYDPGQLPGPQIYNLAPTPLINVESGKTFLELLIPALVTGMYRIVGYYPELSLDVLYQIEPYYKYDDLWLSYEGADFENSIGNSWIKFKSDPQDPESELIYSYKFINIDDGFDRTVNQISITNTNPITQSSTSYAPLTDSASINEWGPGSVSVATTLNPDTNPFWLPPTSMSDQVEIYQNNVLEIQANPKVLINSITIDIMKQFIKRQIDLYGFPISQQNLQIGRTIYIEHKIDENTTISGNYRIVGLTHTVDKENWFLQLILAESEIESFLLNKPKIPEITVTPTSGGVSTDFTATITNYSTEELADIVNIEWFLNDNQGIGYISPPSHWKILGVGPYEEEDLSNIPIITTTEPTITWAYGSTIFNGYPGTMIGPGVYTVHVYVTNSAGLTTSGYFEYVEISGQDAYADFTFSKNEYDGVTFLDASGADTVSWAWDFGDGTTYNGKTPPEKNYTATGTYNVTLTVTNASNDTDTIVKPVTITNVLLPVRYIRFRFTGTGTDVLNDNSFSIYTRNTSNVTTEHRLKSKLVVRKPMDINIPFYPGYDWGGICDESFITDNAAHPWLDPLWITRNANIPGTSGLSTTRFIQKEIGGVKQEFDFDIIADLAWIYNPEEFLAEEDKYSPPPCLPPDRTDLTVWREFRGGWIDNIDYWFAWGTGTGSSTYNQRYKIANIFLRGLSENFDYKPIEIAVSHDGVTYRQIGTTKFQTKTTPADVYSITTLTTPMPPTFGAPIVP